MENPSAFRSLPSAFSAFCLLPSAFCLLPSAFFDNVPQSALRLNLPHFKVRVSDHEPRGKEPARYSLEQPSNRASNRKYP